ncbi:MAG: NAD(P)-dependent oxidoreductase [Pseudomonadota bacterium]
MRIALLGTGLMGAPMARNLAKAGHHMTVWNRSPDKAEALGDIAKVAKTPAGAAKDAEAVVAMLLDGPITESVLHDQGAIAAAGAGALIIDMGSVNPDCDQRLARHAAGLGKGFLDAPVSGGVVGAEAGTLAILVGGTEADFKAAEPVFAALGRATHLGPTGAGQVAKLANQLIVGTTIGAVAEAFKLAEASGCDPATLRDALRGGFADSRILDLQGARMAARDFTPGGRSDVQLKDLRNALAFAQENGLGLPLCQTAADAYRDFVDNFDGALLDHAAYYLWLEKRAVP